MGDGASETHLGSASEVGIEAERVRVVLAAIAPIVGTARVASATGKIVDTPEIVNHATAETPLA